MNRLIFLGSGGGRGMIRTQERKTGGMFLELENASTPKASSSSMKLSIDPGPGALVTALSLKLQPEKWNGLLLSHLHTDHSGDANAMIDCMSGATDARDVDLSLPFVVAERHCLQPKDSKEKVEDYYPCITAYHQKLAKCYAMDAGKTLKIKDLNIKAVPADHYFPTVGFLIKSDGKTIGYTSDGAYYSGMEKNYNGCDLLVMNVSIPIGMEAKPHFHMTTGDAVKLLKLMENKPQLAVINHATPLFMRSNIWKQIRVIQDATKVRAINSEDGMEIDLGNLEKPPRMLNQKTQPQEKISFENIR